ncbi:MAG: NUDIX domain-containing protein [Gammaproteobacteria bacterium]|nr:NUDIX domain-containing protein [Gammaproteobacteria bacterium]
MRELLILRHGKAETPAGVDDRQRPLADKGKRAVQRIGVWLAQHDGQPDHVVTSPAERAATSAAKCAKAMLMDARRIVEDVRAYDAGISDLLALLADCPVDAQRVLLVGHNPGLRKLGAWLVGDAEMAGKLPTGTLWRIELPDDWSALASGQGRLVAAVRGTELPRGFPYPSPHGDERRDRPAYYYAQSSVVPYRIASGALEVLIVRSSQNKHWVVPKGIADPGLSLQESAAKEAWEEAGVAGEVGDVAIGSYDYPKWGATCSVQVYPMRVTRVLDDAEWQERHRGREWVSPRVAAMLLKQPELGEIVTAFSRDFDAGGPACPD